MKIKEIILEYKRDITASKLGEKLYAKLSSEPKDWIRRGIGFDINNIDKNKVIDAILQKIEAADPTNNKQYVTWIIRVYLNTRIHLEDAITKPTGALAKFYKLTRAKKIQPPYNDINRIKDINQLEEVVSQFPDEEKVLVDKGKYEEIYRDNEIRVIVPLDKTAACYYGQGTKWCTAANTNNMFNTYTHNEAKLYIILPQNPAYPGEKYQFSFEHNQFMNELDKPINPVKIFNKYPSLRQVFKTILFGDTYEFLVYKNPSDDLLIRAVTKNAMLIRYIKNPSEAVQIAAVKVTRFAIKYIKNPSETVQLVTVNRNGLALQYIKTPSEKVQLAAVKSNGFAIEYIKNPSEALQLTAVSMFGRAIEHIKNPNETVQLAAVKENGYAIEYIQDPSEEVQFAAIKENIDALHYIKTPTPKVVKLFQELTT